MFSPSLIPVIDRHASPVADACFPFLEGHLVFAKRKWPRELNVENIAFVVRAAEFVWRRAEAVFSGWYDHHLRAGIAVTKYAAGPGGLLRMTGQREQ